MSEQTMLPALVEHDGSAASVLERISGDRPALRRRLVERGAVLLRGFDIGGVDGFAEVVRAFSGDDPLTYAERSSPRHSIKGDIYTSTDYPPAEEIFLHNENSYQAVWPRTLFFHCLREPLTEGATPLADIREIWRLVDPSVREEFTRRRWRVVRNFHPGFGVPWREVFGTADRAQIEQYCRERGMQAEWLGRDSMRTTAVREAVHTHPVSGEPVWFNHTTFFHVSTLSTEVREGLLGIFDEADLPTNTYFGDGGRIPDDVMEHLRACYRQASRRFDWRQGDVLVVDNMAAAHGREPFTGPRRIAVAMAEPSTAANTATTATAATKAPAEVRLPQPAPVTG
ncbi:TauD/TfdA family dioxygenase [Kineosporia babensis]|uniref:TauD/TfdA family dioxygenase n=1 Tax=Kineosporia babensis TaxID=499548 RepID=A0A9X1NDB7_9ACTN|nr:TauD/TfdA family dioxygenase [Kineosporia babensis]MCD5312023.1 TauD/TfdA family dioxygenase [Kineosporia babensis]